MQHTYEFIATMSDGKEYRAFYKGKTSRKSKVDKLIRQDICKVYGVNDQDITGIKMRPIK